MIGRPLLSFLVLVLAAAPVWAIETAKVEVSGGAPRLLVDGKPVRARMFWGAPGSRPLPVKAAGELITFEFSPTQDELKTATMHLRFGQTAGEVFLDDIQVMDLEDGKEVFPKSDFEGGQGSFEREWTFWPPKGQNNVGSIRVEPKAGREGSSGLRVTLKAPADGKWPDFHIYHHPTLALRKGHRYRVSFWAKAAPARDLVVAFYRPGQPFVQLGGPGGVFENQIKLAAGAGVSFVSFPVPLPWPRPGQAVDWSGVDAACQKVLDVNPQALLVPRIGVGAPKWWLEAHPEDAMVWDDGAHQSRPATVASADFVREASQRLFALVEHLEQKFGRNVAGYHPCGQNTGEWFYEDTWKRGLNGYAKADEKAWRAWLTTRYKEDAALRSAWRDAQVSLETATVPAPGARRAAPNGVLRDPVTERALIDFAEFQQQTMAECVCALAKAVREGSRGRKLVVFFYGYVFEFGPVANGPATSGHYALRRVLDCPDIDVLCSPISYFDRGLGQSAPAMTAAESVALAGKMWLYEDDTHTHLATGQPPGWADHVDTLEKTNQQLLRNTGQCALRNFGTWWMDLLATGWFNGPGMWEQMVKLKGLDEAMLERPTAFRPEVAAILDERSMLRVAAGGQAVTVPGVYEARRALGRMGMPYGQYLQDDLLTQRVQAKAYVLLTSWCLDAQQRKQLLLATRGTMRIWCYAPGYQEPAATSMESMRELTGFQVKKVSGFDALATPTAQGQKLGLSKPIGVKKRIAPLFAAADATAEETLATYPDGSAAVAMRKTADGWSLFVGPPGLSSELLRLAGRRAGAHLYTQTDCNVYASGRFVVLHGSQEGPVEIDTGRNGAVRDYLTGQTVGRGPKLMLPLSFGQTKILVLDEAK